jgi:Ca2+-binding EF-hand superfamily protein
MSGASADPVREALAEEVRTMVLDRVREIRQGCLVVDPRATGLISVADFRKVLYFDGGLPYTAVTAVMASIPAQEGYVHYDLWIHGFLNATVPQATAGQPAVPAPLPTELRFGEAPNSVALMVDELRHVVVGNFDRIMRIFVTKDSAATGLVPMADFKRVLYLDLGISPAHLDILFNSVGCADSGFMDYAEWLRFVVATPMPVAADFRMFYRASTVDPSAAPAGGPPPDLLRAEEAALHGGPQDPAEAEKQMAVRDEHIAAEQHRSRLAAQIAGVDSHIRDLAIERHMLDARVAEEARVLQDTLAKEEEHALLRHALAEPPSHAKFTQELLAEKRARQLTPAQHVRLVDELLNIQTASPTRAMGFVQRMHLEPSEKLDLYRDLRGTSAKEERFKRDLRVLEYLNGYSKQEPVGPQREAAILDELRRSSATPAKKVQLLKEMPIDAAKRLKLLHDLRLYNVIDESLATN